MTYSFVPRCVREPTGGTERRPNRRAAIRVFSRHACSGEIESLQVRLARSCRFQNQCEAGNGLGRSPMDAQETYRRFTVISEKAVSTDASVFVCSLRACAPGARILGRTDRQSVHLGLRSRGRTENPCFNRGEPS